MKHHVALPILIACGLLASLPALAAKGVNAKTSAFCQRMQATLQPFVKVPLALFSADDSSTDDMHTGEAHYVHCQFRQKDNSMIDIGLHDDDDGMFDDASKPGYAAQPGYGDKARYTVRGSAGQKWIDVVHDKVACEARFALDTDGTPLTGDWKEVGGKACVAALSLR